MKRSLNLHQTSALIEELHTKELHAIQTHRYRSLAARSRDLASSKRSYALATGLLEAEAKWAPKGEQNNTFSNKLWEVTRGGIRFAYEAIRNLQLREEYLGYQGYITSTHQAMKNTAENITKLRNPPQSNNESFESFLSEVDKEIQAAMKIKTAKVINATTLLSDSENQINNLEELFDEWANNSSYAWRPKLIGKDWNSALLRAKKDLRSILNAREVSNSIPLEQWGKAPELHVPEPIDPERLLLHDFKISEQNDIIQTSHKYFIENRLQAMMKMRQAGMALTVLTGAIMVWYIVMDEQPARAAGKAAFSIPPILLTGYGGAQGAAYLFASLGGKLSITIGGIFGGFLGGFVGGLAADYLFEAIVMSLTSTIPDQLKTSMFAEPYSYELVLPNTYELSRSFTYKLNYLAED